MITSLKTSFTMILALSVFIVMAQQRKITTERVFQFSLTPGLSTNGLHPASYSNYFSVNLTSGYSGMNYLLEIAGISNLNVNGTKGLQFAGIANLTGANAFAGMQLKEMELKIKSGFEANLVGIQIAGLTNIVINTVFGAQLTAGVNVSKGALMGFQLAGISNNVHKYSFGFQLAGLWNTSVQSMDGVQVAMLANYTEGGLYGIQLGAFNHIGFSEGMNSKDNDDPTGIQVGLLNKAGRMNGIQVGLINIGKQVQGTQLGLINIYRGGKNIGTKDGTSIGLVNIGDFGYLSVYSNELFAFNYEIATGNRKNTRMQANNFSYMENALIYSHQTWSSEGKGRWGLGYGLKRMIFNKSSLPGMSEFRFFSYGVDWVQINQHAGKITKELSLLSRLKVAAGTRLHPKIFNIYIFGAITANTYLSKNYSMAPGFLSSEKSVASNNTMELWPGFSAGVLIH